MQPQIYHLPSVFSNNSEPSDTYLHLYKTRRPSAKSKVQFSHNLLCLMLEGQKEVFSPSSHLLIDHTQFFMLQAGQVLMSELIPEQGQYRAILLFFSNDFLANFCFKNKLTTPSPSDIQEFMYCFDKDNFILNFQNSILLAPPNLLAQSSYQQNKIEEILHYLCATHPPLVQRFIYNCLQANKDAPFREIIAQQFDKNLTLTELAFLCNMSLSTFKRKFAELYNTSPKRYFMELKMSKAKELLSQHKRPSEIYLELGYENLSAFSNEFKKYVGVAPKYFAV